MSILIVVFYKTTKCLIDQINTYLQMNYGYQGIRLFTTIC